MCGNQGERDSWAAFFYTEHFGKCLGCSSVCQERVSGLHPLLSHCSSSEGQVVRNLKVEEGRKALNNLGMKRFTILLIF